MGDLGPGPSLLVAHPGCPSLARAWVKGAHRCPPGGPRCAPDGEAFLFSAIPRGGGDKGFQGRRIPHASTSLQLGEEALGMAMVQMTVPQHPCHPITSSISIPGRMGGGRSRYHGDRRAQRPGPTHRGRSPGFGGAPAGSHSPARRSTGCFRRGCCWGAGCAAPPPQLQPEPLGPAAPAVQTTPLATAGHAPSDDACPAHTAPGYQVSIGRCGCSSERRRRPERHLVTSLPLAPCDFCHPQVGM